MSLVAGDAVLTDDRGQHRLGPLLKSGGAGSIFSLPETPRLVAKIYHDSVDVAQYARKVAAMLDLSPHLPDIVEDGHRYVQIAWPEALLRDRRGRFLGFLMPAVDVRATSELECILQERQARANGLPTGLGAKITLAANLAAVIAELHRQGHHVVDLKPVNLRFYPRSLYMAMLDCDGFSIQGNGERFAAEQITPDYLAPEFQSQPIPSGGEVLQDRFALAVVIFQLLNFGIHPFTGRPTSDRVPTDVPGRIAQRCYAYGERANPNLQPSPVSGHRAMPQDLRTLFDRAFEGAGSARPAADEWASRLGTYAQRSSHLLSVCHAVNEHQHFTGLPCAACARRELIAATASSARAATAAPRRLPLRMQAMARAISLRLQPRWSATARAQSAPHAPAPHVPFTYATPVQPRSNDLRDKIRLAVFLILAAMAIKRCHQHQLDPLGGESPYSHSSTTITAPERQPLPPPSLMPSVSTGSRDGQVVAAQPEDYIESAERAIADGDHETWEQSLTHLRSTAAAHPAVREQGYQQEFASFSAGAFSDDYDEKRRLLLMGKLQQALRLDPTDDEAAFDLGWLTLLGGGRDAARSLFAQAIQADPDRATAWFGMGIASADDDQAIGFLASAELLNPDPRLARQMRARFPPELLRLCGIKPERFAILEARARRIAGRTRGEPIAAAVEAIANKSLHAQ